MIHTPSLLMGAALAVAILMIILPLVPQLRTVRRAGFVALAVVLFAVAVDQMRPVWPQTSDPHPVSTLIEYRADGSVRLRHDGAWTEVKPAAHGETETWIEDGCK